MMGGRRRQDLAQMPHEKKLDFNSGRESGVFTAYHMGRFAMAIGIWRVERDTRY